MKERISALLFAIAYFLCFAFFIHVLLGTFLASSGAHPMLMLAVALSMELASLLLVFTTPFGIGAVFMAAFAVAIDESALLAIGNDSWALWCIFLANGLLAGVVVFANIKSHEARYRLRPA